MIVSDPDEVLLILLTVARLGEKELMHWWNTDIAYKLGGADFLIRLVGPKTASLAAGEGILFAARLKEERLIDLIPGDAAFSLFCPEPALRLAVNRRYRYLKTYPDELPTDIAELLDPEREWTAPELMARLETPAPLCFQGTSFGREVQVDATWSDTEKVRALANTYVIADRGNYVMAYYRNGDVA